MRWLGVSVLVLVAVVLFGCTTPADAGEAAGVRAYAGPLMSVATHRPRLFGNCGGGGYAVEEVQACRLRLRLVREPVTRYRLARVEASPVACCCCCCCESSSYGTHTETTTWGTTPPVGCTGPGCETAQ